MSEETTESSSSAPKKDVGAAIKGMGAADKLIAIGAAAFMLAFLVEGPWKSLFKFGSAIYGNAWFMTLGFLGSIGVLVLIVTKLLDVKLMDAKLAAKLLIICAAAPALGWVIDSLKNFWYFLAMISVAVMAFGATRLVATKD